MKISTVTLMKIASIGGVATVSMGLLTRWKISNNLANTETIKEVLNVVRKNPAAVELLGEPIRTGNINIDDGNNYVTQTDAHFQVPVKGSKQKGVVNFWANKIDDKWIVPKIVLELQNDKSNTLIIKSDINQIY